MKNTTINILGNGMTPRTNEFHSFSKINIDDSKESNNIHKHTNYLLLRFKHIVSENIHSLVFLWFGLVWFASVLFRDHAQLMSLLIIISHDPFIAIIILYNMRKCVYFSQWWVKFKFRLNLFSRANAKGAFWLMKSFRNDEKCDDVILFL